MSKATELLNSIGEEQISLLTVNPETEPHIVIGDDRFITVPNELKRLAVQYDHDIETVTFDCPRYWDGFDMSTMPVYINYKRSDKYKDSYKATNVVVDETDANIMHFDWTISRNVTEVYGAIVFLVCVKKVDDDGIERNHWNSELYKECYVSEGMECVEEGQVNHYDYLASLEQEYRNSFDALKAELLAAAESGEFNGEDGVSPIIEVAELEDGHRVTITDKSGEKSFDVSNGQNGSNGKNGTDGKDAVSPTISITDIAGGHRVTITDVNGTRSFDVMDGTTDVGDAVETYMNNYLHIGGVEPTSGPVLWFDTSATVN